MKARKYNYAKVIQQHYGYHGWEDVSEYNTNSQFLLSKENRALLKHDVAEYRLIGYPTRIIQRRTLN